MLGHLRQLLMGAAGVAPSCTFLPPRVVPCDLDASANFSITSLQRLIEIEYEGRVHVNPWSYGVISFIPWHFLAFGKIIWNQIKAATTDVHPPLHSCLQAVSERTMGMFQVICCCEFVGATVYLSELKQHPTRGCLCASASSHGIHKHGHEWQHDAQLRERLLRLLVGSSSVASAFSHDALKLSLFTNFLIDAPTIPAAAA